LAAEAKKELSSVLPICDSAIRLTLIARLRCHLYSEGLEVDVVIETDIYTTDVFVIARGLYETQE
jgi:hypothetical protein